MRIRKVLMGLALGATAGLGLVAAPAQAAPAAPSASISAASWHYLDNYPTRFICEDAAAQVRAQNGVPTQCRGPYAGGAFHLYYWG